MCLGEALGCVDSDSDKYDFLQTVQQGNIVCQHLSVLLEINTLIYYATMLSYIGRLLIPKATDEKGVGKLMGVSMI